LESQLKIRTTLRVVAALITSIAWWITFSQSRQMGLLMRLGVPMSLSMEGRANPSSFVLFTAPQVGLEPTTLRLTVTLEIRGQVIHFPALRKFSKLGRARSPVIYFYG
jgi:hypothetical protein